MSSIVGIPRACAAGSRNTGTPNGCVVTLEQINGFLLCYDGFKIPAASQDSWSEVLTYLQTATLSSSYLERLYPVLQLNDFTDNTDAPQVKKNGFGDNIAIFEQPFMAEIELENLGIEFMKNIRGFGKAKNLRMYIVTDEFIGGYLDSTGDFCPFECTFISKGVKVGKRTGDQTKYLFDVTLKNPVALTDLIEPIVFPENTDLSTELNGLTDVVLTATGGSLSAQIEATEKMTKANFGTKFATEIMANASDIILVDGASATVASVSSSGVILVNGLTAGTRKIKLNVPVDLTTSGIGSVTSGGYESNEVTVTVTA